MARTCHRLSYLARVPARTVLPTQTACPYWSSFSLHVHQQHPARGGSDGGVDVDGEGV